MKRLIFMLICGLMLLGCSAQVHHFDLQQVNIAQHARYGILSGISSDRNYEFYIKIEDYYRLVIVRYYRVHIYETDSKPYAVAYQGSEDMDNEYQFMEWELHIPNNSIHYKYEVNLK